MYSSCDLYMLMSLIKKQHDFSVFLSSQRPALHPCQVSTESMVWNKWGIKGVKLLACYMVPLSHHILSCAVGGWWKTPHWLVVSSHIILQVLQHMCLLCITNIFPNYLCQKWAEWGNCNRKWWAQTIQSLYPKTPEANIHTNRVNQLVSRSPSPVLKLWRYF